MKEQYGEYEIRYDETSEKFTAYIGDERVTTGGKLADVKKRLDRVGEVRAKFAGFKVLSVETGGRMYGDDAPPRIVEWRVTSVVQGQEVWMTNTEDSTRQKSQLGDRGYKAFYSDTPEVRAELEAIVQLYKQRDALDKRLARSLTLVKRATVPAGVETESS